ncbi:MAG: BamA/TamA family outer membrane protein [Balneolales bacterium]
MERLPKPSTTSIRGTPPKGACYSLGWMLLAGRILQVLVLFIGLYAFPAHGTSSQVSTGSSEDNGQPERVWEIDFEGNESYPGIALLNIIALEAPSFFRKMRFWNRSGYDFDANELQRDEIRIERFYQRRGFPHVQVNAQVDQGRKEWSRHVLFLIDEGDPTIIDTVQYEFNADPNVINHLEEQRDFQRVHRRRVMQPGRRYQLIQHSEVEGAYLSVMRNLGYAHADVLVSATIDTTDNKAEVLITLNPGPLTRFGSIHVEGTETVSDNHVRRQSELMPGDQYSSGKLRIAQQQIFGHPLFRFATVNMPSESRDSVVDITIRVREHALRSLSLQGGVGFEEIVRTRISWQHRNPFGNAHNFTTTIRASFLEQRGNMDYHIPYVFNPKSRINISPFGQRLDERGYLLLRGGINNSFIYQIRPETAWTVSYEFTRNRERLRNPDITLPQEEQLYDISAFQLSGYYNRLEVEQYEGWAIRPYAEFSGILGTGSLRYNRYSLDIRRYQDLGPDTQLAIRNEGGIISFTGLEELPSNLRFYTGGTASVRGWHRRNLGPKRVVLDEEGRFVEYIPIGGKAMYHFNLEIRQNLNQLIRRLGISVFLDGGSVWEETKHMSLDEFQYGLGGGLHYHSPIGPVRIDLARKLNPTDEDLNIYNGEDYGNWFNRWGIHFSIGHAF